MLETKKDRIAIVRKDGISIRYFEITEEKEAIEFLNRQIEKDSEYYSKPQHEIKTINAYWGSGFPSQKRI